MQIGAIFPQTEIGPDPGEVRAQHMVGDEDVSVAQVFNGLSELADLTGVGSDFGWGNMAPICTIALLRLFAGQINTGGLAWNQAITRSMTG